MLCIYGMPVIENIHWVNRKQSKTHRCKRINKKWLKRYGFSITPRLDVVKMGNSFMMHPTVAEKLKNALDKKG